MVRKSWATDKIDWSREYAHWGWLKIQLPEEGVAAAFPDEASCLSRLIAVRWPDAVQCPRCKAKRPFRVPSEARWQCRECRHQFSPTSGTLFHKTRQDLRVWFLAAEYMIENTPWAMSSLLPTVEEFEDRFGLWHPTATRLRQKLYGDLCRNNSQSLLAKLILTRPIEPPSGMEPGTEEFRWWLKGEAEVRGVRLKI